MGVREWVTVGTVVFAVVSLTVARMMAGALREARADAADFRRMLSKATEATDALRDSQRDAAVLRGRLSEIQRICEGDEG